MSLWNYTIDDASPYLSYSPYGDGPATASGWRTWYTGSHYISSPDQISRGNSYHNTSLRNANVTFKFFGTGITLFGSTNSSLFNVIIDDETNITSPSSDSVLFSSQNLLNKLHTVTLSAQPSSVGNFTENLGFDFAITSTALENDENPPSPAFYDSTDTKSFVYSGIWTPTTQVGVPNATVTSPFYQTTQVNATVSFSFSGANAVAVKGLASSENGLYSVSLDGHSDIFNGTSLWTIPDALLFFRAGLDPNTTHQLSIVNLSSRLCLNSFTVFEHESKDIDPNTSGNTAPAPPHQDSSSIGVIVGPVVGCVLLLMAIGFFVWFCRRRQGSKRHLVIQGLKSKLTSPKARHRSQTPPRQSTVISPMLATLSQADRPVTSDVQSTSTGTSSDIHSSTNLLKGSASYGDRSIQSVVSSSAANSRMGYMVQDPFGGWESPCGPYVPPMPSQASSSSGHHIGPSLGSASQMSIGTQHSPRRSLIQTSNSCMSESGSSRHRTQPPALDYMQRPSRGPLPPIPVPSYDAALRDPAPTPDEIREMESLQLSESSRYRRRLSTFTAVTAVTAPPQYEQ
ncbi:hypothetical protein E4T56_gene15573 [Termitomyces sp. T112]|nr:hypothetical protein E4T56_gene15573 [Termitomyces sp. T112]